MLVLFSSLSRKGLSLPSSYFSRQHFLLVFTVLTFPPSFPFLKDVILICGLSDLAGAELLRGRKTFFFVPGDRIALALMMLAGSLLLLEMDLEASLSDSTLSGFAGFMAFFPPFFWWNSLDRVDWLEALVTLRRPLRSAGFNVFFPLTVLVTLHRFLELMDVDLFLNFETRRDFMLSGALLLELSLGYSFCPVDWLDAIVVRLSFCGAVFNVVFSVNRGAGRAIWFIFVRSFDLEILDFFLSFGRLDRLEDLPSSFLPFDVMVFSSFVRTFGLVVALPDLV